MPRTTDSEASSRPEQDALAATGYDLSLLEENLRLTPRERLRRHGRFLRMIEALRGPSERDRERS